MNYPDNKKRYVSITRRLPFNVRDQKTVVRSGLSRLLLDRYTLIVYARLWHGWA